MRLVKHPDLPTQDLLVSSASREGEVLTLRLLAELQPDAQALAYVVHAFEPEQADAALAFALRAAESGRPMNLAARGDKLVLATADREEHVLTARRFTAKPTPPSMAEIADTARRVYGWYLAEGKANRRNTARLQRVRELLLEQARKVRSIAQGHAPDSEIGQLCAQQVEFIERLFHETEA